MFYFYLFSEKTQQGTPPNSGEGTPTAPAVEGSGTPSGNGTDVPSGGDDPVSKAVYDNMMGNLSRKRT